MLVIAPALVASRCRLIRRLRGAGALTPEEALSLAASRPLTRWWRDPPVF
jgi:hypothetical protein